MTESNPPSSPARIWLSLISGCLLGLPAGWLLATLAALPMFLGLFFFLIFGLFIGALMFRLGRPAAPAPKSKLILIGCLVALTVWGSALYVEYSQLPQDAARVVRDSFEKRFFTPQEKLRLQDETRDYVLAKLKQDYPPGGCIGYIRWAATQGTMEFPRIFSDDTETHALHQTGLSWTIRVVLSLLLIGFTIFTQFIGLTNSLAKPTTTPKGAEADSDDMQA